MVKSRVLCRLVILPALFALEACSSLGRNTSGFPVEIPLAENHFPTNSEILASVELSQAASSEKFLVALGTRDGGLELAVLTPQGLPLYTVDYSSGRWKVLRKAAAARQFNPDELLAYLGLIYFDEEAIAALLQDNWHHQASSGERVFLSGGNGSLAAAEVHIRYEGEGPWYQAVRMEDTVRGRVLDIRILEVKHVLPE